MTGQTFGKEELKTHISDDMDLFSSRDNRLLIHYFIEKELFIPTFQIKNLLSGYLLLVIVQKLLLFIWIFVFDRKINK